MSKHRTLAASLAAFAFAFAGCAESTEVRVLFDLTSPELFQHVAAVDFSLHELPEETTETNAQLCLDLRREVEGPGFTVPPIRSIDRIEPCDLATENITVPDLPDEGSFAYLVALRSVDGEALATGCAVRRLDEFAIDDAGARVLTIVTLSTPFYDSEVAGTTPMFEDLESRCGVTAEE